MLGFFLCIIIMLVLMIRGLGEISGRSVHWLAMYNDEIEEARKKGYDVAFKIYYSNTFKEKRFIGIDVQDCKSKVIPKKDKDGIGRWYYNSTDCHDVCCHKNNSVLMSNFNKAKQEAIWKGQKWFTVPYFWDTRLANSYKGQLPHYLDNYQDHYYVNDVVKGKVLVKTIEQFTEEKKYENGRLTTIREPIRTSREEEQYFYDNSFCNQKIYLKNLRAYELHMGEVEGEVQYFIRFAKKDFDYTCVHMYEEKLYDKYWTKWFAITEEQYKSLSNQIDYKEYKYKMGYDNFQYMLNRNWNVAINDCLTEKDLENYRKQWEYFSELKKIRLGNDVNKPSIIKKEELIWAFDEEGNFVGDDI